ncbi:hypothetical protein [Roseococcus microcysteis]|uniref:hypothetical protein n=1 Tax=Roseococcus microcysteis TaxID=2771361 RepID=UPI001CC74BA8|nr:hypothetical protein [Roseococcus microcysteis]
MRRLFLAIFLLGALPVAAQQAPTPAPQATPAPEATPAPGTTGPASPPPARPKASRRWCAACCPPW